MFGPSRGAGAPVKRWGKGGKMRGTKVAAFVIAAVALLAVVAPAANAGPTSSTTAIVALGDSFSSGEAGRWNGNSLNIFGTRDGTDRAARCTLGIFCSYDATRVYGSSYDNGCHRADVAPIKSAPISVNEKINLACSGAQTDEHLARIAGRPGVQGRGSTGGPAAADRAAEERQAGAAQHHRERPRLHEPRDRLHRRLDARLHLQRAGAGRDRRRRCPPRRTACARRSTRSAP